MKTSGSGPQALLRRLQTAESGSSRPRPVITSNILTLICPQVPTSWPQSWQSIAERSFSASSIEIVTAADGAL